MLSVRWFPPSWLLLEHPGGRLYVDPAYLSINFARHPARVEYSRWPDPIDGLPEPDLPIADAILVTHHHKDHCKAVTVRRLSSPATVLVAPRRCRAELGDGVRDVAPGDELRLAGVDVVAVHAYNTPEGSSTRKQHKRGECVGYLIARAGVRVLHAGDTDAIPELATLGPVDVAFLPVGGTFTMDAAEAAQALEAIRPRLAVPMHYRDPADAEAFREAARAAGFDARVLAIGERVALPG